MSTKDKKPDLELFREAMADVRPLSVPDRLAPTPKNTPPRARQLEKDNERVMQELLSDEHWLVPETGEELNWLKPGYQKRLLNRLRRGHYSVADTIDLHHMDVETARRVLLDFLEMSLQRQYGSVRVIHGKGLRSRDIPRLKALTRRILRKHPRVVAFASCRPVDGGHGATDVLLSTRSRPRSSA
jgi:DNA-nicking Smr family endonuclease